MIKNNSENNSDHLLKNQASEHFANSLNVIINATKIGLWDWHLPSGKVIYSKQWEKIAGYEEGELPQDIQSWEKAVLPEDLIIANEAIEQYLAGKADQYEAEFRMVRKDGTIIWAQDRGNITEWDKNGKPVRLVGVIQDVTKIKMAEYQLKTQTEQLDFVAGMVGLASWEWNVPQEKISYNADFLKMIGYEKKEITGTFEEWESLIHPDDLSATNKALADFIDGKTDTYSKEIRIRHKNGNYIWTHDTGRIIERDKDGNPVKVLGGHLNIDKIKETEEKLKIILAEKEKYSEVLQSEIKKAVKELEESQLINKTMFDANPYVNLLFDQNFKIIDCNPAAIEYLGFKSREDLLENIMQLIKESIPQFQPGGKQSATLEKRLEKVVQEGYSEFETELIIRGNRIPMKIIMKKIRYRDSFAIVLYQLDLKNLKEAKNELIRQDRLLKAVNDVAYLLMGIDFDSKEFLNVIVKSLRILGESVNADRSYIWRNITVNEKLYCRQVAEWAKTAYSKQNSAIVSYEEYVPNWQEIINNKEGINSIVNDLDPATIRFPGMEDVFSVLVIPIFLHGEFWGFIGFDNCKTQQLFTEAEENIMKSAGLLISSAIARNETAQNLIQAKEEALASTKAKSDFLSRMSHEIRTPMNAIIGMTTIAKKTDDPSKIAYCLDKIDNASGQLLGLINDILDMSKIEANKLEIVKKEFNFEKMIQDVFNIINVKVEEKKQNFSFNFESIFTRYVVSDEMRLSQVVLNLLSNAVKFTPENGTITLSISQIPTDEFSSVLRIEVKDTGIGIADNMKKKLFNSFEQVDGTITRKYGGTGLGLAICKKIALLMGGNIRVESEPGKGSNFIFEVGINWGEELCKKEFPKKLKSSLHILVVDDNEDVLIYFKNVLTAFSITCDTAESGQEALDKVRESINSSNPYDLIFIDWKMPEMNGLEAAEKIKKLMDKTVVVMISVADWSDIQPEAEKIGVTQFLPKPVLPSTLYNKIVELTTNTLVTENRDIKPGDINWKDKKILLVEDIDINREIILEILDNTGIKVECAENGKEAVDMFMNSGNNYDLILMDIQMPLLDGFGATKSIRKSGKNDAKKIPILAMTANAFKEDVDKCLEAGMNDHIAKPIDINILIDKLSHYLVKQ